MKTIVTGRRHAFVDLLNSEHIHGPGRVTDHLEDSAWTAAMVRQWGLPEAVTSEDASELLALRALLRAAVRQIVEEGRLAPASLDTLNQWLGRDGSRSSIIERGGKYIIVRPSASPSTYAARSFADYLIGGDLHRLKLCANNHCQRVFEDTSRNRSKRWCSSKSCGNLTKVRAFRQRAKQSVVPTG